MKVPTQAAVALSAFASIALILGGAIVLLERAAPGPALIRVAEGVLPDCDGTGIEVFGGRDRDRNGVLAADETELTGIVCKVGDRLEAGYEPEPFEDPVFERTARARERQRVLMEFRDHPWDDSCPDGGLSVVVGVDRDQDARLTVEEISETRVFCGAPGARLHARSR